MKTFKPSFNTGIEILVSDSCGIYIPKMFATGFEMEYFEGIESDDLEILKNPDHSEYWDAWESVINSATAKDNDGHTWTLHQDGDLFLVCIEKMTDDEKHNFGWDE